MFQNYQSDIAQENRYYPFGMLMDMGDSLGYRFGFGGHELDNNVKGNGNHLSFGDYGYDPRLGRRWRPDPLKSEMASWSPYTYCFNNPIVYVDEDGRWPGVKYIFFELDLGIGLSYGINYVEQEGIAYDKVGKTHFTMSSYFDITTQEIEGSNPQIVSGLSASLSGGFTWDWSSNTFIGDVSEEYNGEAGGFEVYAAVGGEIAYGKKRFSFKAGLGAGVKLSVINTQVKQSISLTDKEAKEVSDATYVWT